MKLARTLNVVAGMAGVLGLMLGLARFPASAGAVRQPTAAASFESLGSIRVPQMTELSGLHASRIESGLMWGLNDSGNPPELLAFDTSMQFRHAVRVEDVVNQDWEDLGGFEDGGQSWLVVADTGDNLGLRSEAALIFVPEPAPGAVSVKPARILRFTFEDGPRDCEAMAVDPIGRRILLADKGRHPAGLYELAIDGSDQGRKARRIADFPDLMPHPAPRVQTAGSQRWRGTPTSMDLSADGRRLIVLTYQSLSLFQRRSSDEDWSQTLARAPARSLRIPRFGGFEALAFESGERTALLGSEGASAIIQRWTQAFAP
ncbi:MAG: hypothetical protein ACT4QA_06515 [Panacagrimonas sp.]